jgi:hypothetical protein
MSCNGYKPEFQEQLDGSPLGSLSCTCYAGAMVGEYDTCGSQTPTGRYVRVLTGDSSGGTTLPQVDAALRKGYGINLDTRIGSEALSWATFMAQIKRGKAAILQGGYGPINDSRFQGSETFRGNHAIAVLPGLIVMDPLADGRRAGIYRYRGEAYPEDLLRRFASQLVLDPETGRKAGTAVWCSLSRDNTTTWRAVVKAPPGGTYPIYFYRLTSTGLIRDRSIKRTQGINVTCTAPKLYRAAPGVAIPSKSLVKLTEGVHEGVYIQSVFAKELP